jgi:hypothetical protein
MKRRSNFSVEALLSGIGAMVIFVLLTAGVLAALRRKIFA